MEAFYQSRGCIDEDETCCRMGTLAARVHDVVDTGLPLAQVTFARGKATVT
jgi:hypothetical protein